LRLRQQNREAMRKIELSETWLRTIVNTTLSGFAIFDRDGYLTWTNESSKEIHGYNVEDVIGKHFYVFTHPEDQILGSQIIEKIVTGEVHYFDGEFRIMHKETGKAIWIHVIATPFPKNIRSEKEKILLYYQNITKQKDYEIELKALNATKDKFFSIIAHDLRNPFVALLGLSELVLAKYHKITEEDRRKKLEMMHESARLTYELLENLLAWSLSQSGGIAYKPARISLSNMLANTTKLYQASANNKNITLTNTLSKKYFVYADAYMLETILRSLISNAIKFTPRYGEVTIGINELSSNGFAEIYVCDNGIGIPPETLDELFRIDRKNTTQGTEKEKGSGLGLILCKEFVEKHGGQIRAENNTTGKGCRFIFTIPATAPAG
ncbi:MAG: PAS domain S-box protein, partial [Bacteroidales bacterium]|nr:PAS domain S-box protein [Bacteroidales bacterium]